MNNLLFCRALVFFVLATSDYAHSQVYPSCESRNPPFPYNSDEIAGRLVVEAIVSSSPGDTDAPFFESLDLVDNPAIVDVLVSGASRFRLFDLQPSGSSTHTRLFLGHPVAPFDTFDFGFGNFGLQVFPENNLFSLNLQTHTGSDGYRGNSVDAPSGTSAVFKNGWRGNNVDSSACDPLAFSRYIYGSAYASSWEQTCWRPRGSSSISSRSQSMWSHAVSRTALRHSGDILHRQDFCFSVNARLFVNEVTVGELAQPVNVRVLLTTNRGVLRIVKALASGTSLTGSGFSQAAAAPGESGFAWHNSDYTMSGSDIGDGAELLVALWSGDVWDMNADSSFDMSDVILLEQLLLATPQLSSDIDLLSRFNLSPKRRDYTGSENVLDPLDVIDNEDISILQAIAMTDIPFTGLIGDYNNDSVVDCCDYVDVSLYGNQVYGDAQYVRRMDYNQNGVMDSVEWTIHNRRLNRADMNGDALVDDADFILFSDYYANVLDTRGDLDNSASPSLGVTDDEDFALFASSYNELLICPGINNCLRQE